MSCVHLKKLFQLCEEHQIEFSSGDLVHIVCKQCQQQEVCPARSVESELEEVEERGAAPAESPQSRPS